MYEVPERAQATVVKYTDSVLRTQYLLSFKPLIIQDCNMELVHIEIGKVIGMYVNSAILAPLKSFYARTVPSAIALTNNLFAQPDQLILSLIQTNTTLCT